MRVSRELKETTIQNFNKAKLNQPSYVDLTKKIEMRLTDDAFYSAYAEFVNVLEKSNTKFTTAISLAEGSENKKRREEIRVEYLEAQTKAIDEVTSLLNDSRKWCAHLAKLNGVDYKFEALRSRASASLGFTKFYNNGTYFGHTYVKPRNAHHI